MVRAIPGTDGNRHRPRRYSRRRPRGRLTMTEIALQPPVLHSHSLLRKVCQLMLWAIIIVKAVWLAMGLSYIGPIWQMFGFLGVLVILAAATWSFHAGNRTLGIGLAWAGVLLAIAIGYYGGTAPGPLTNRIHDQYRTHAADYLFLLIAHIQFWALTKTTA